MFQISFAEFELISRSKILTTIMQVKGIKGGRASFPYAFTKQGIHAYDCFERRNNNERF